MRKTNTSVDEKKRMILCVDKRIKFSYAKNLYVYLLNLKRKAFEV